MNTWGTIDSMSMYKDRVLTFLRNFEIEGIPAFSKSAMVLSLRDIKGIKKDNSEKIPGRTF